MQYFISFAFTLGGNPLPVFSNCMVTRPLPIKTYDDIKVTEQSIIEDLKKQSGTENEIGLTIINFQLV